MVHGENIKAFGQLSRSIRTVMLGEVKLMSLVFVFLTLSLSAFGNPGSWTPSYQKISGIMVEGPEENGRAIILIEGGVPNNYVPDGCNDGTMGTYNTVYLNTEKGRAIYSMALAAYLSEKSVKLALDCAGARPLITHIRLK